MEIEIHTISIWSDCIFILYSDLMGYEWDVPSGNDRQFAIEAMAIEIHDLASNMMLFHSSADVYQRVWMLILCFCCLILILWFQLYCRGL